MPDRLSSSDVSFLYMEQAATPMHVGTLALFRSPDSGFDYDRLLSLVRSRLPLVPRYRQRIRSVPARLANPVWVDDDDFDLEFHVRRSGLPRPGSEEQLRELVARIMSRPLDRSRPLWEMYLVEGIADDRFAILSKAHQAMIDGINTVDIGQVILDPSPEPVEAQSDTWRPGPQPGLTELVTGAVAEVVRRPAALVDTVRSGFSDLRHTVGRVVETAGDVASTVWSAARSAPDTPLNVTVGEQRRFATYDTRLNDYRRIRQAHGGTVNDVALATITGALRIWLYSRGEAVPNSLTIRAMVPVSLRGEADAGALGSRVGSYLIDLPVGEGNPVVRLHRISYAMQAHKETGQAVAADALAGIAGFAPPTLHALGARVASGLSRRLFNLVVINVPGPQIPLYAAGARLLVSYPVVPLAQGHALAIGITSYDGGLHYGLNADRDALPDLDVLAGCLDDALDELKETVRNARQTRSKRRSREV